MADSEAKLTELIAQVKAGNSEAVKLAVVTLTEAHEQFRLEAQTEIAALKRITLWSLIKKCFSR